MTREDAEAAAKAMTAQNYDYAGELLVKWFMTLTPQQVKEVLNHVGRYAEKRGPEWPEWEPPNQ